MKRKVVIIMNATQEARMKELEAKSNRTPAEQQELDALKKV